MSSLQFLKRLYARITAQKYVDKKYNELMSVVSRNCHVFYNFLIIFYRLFMFPGDLLLLSILSWKQFYRRECGGIFNAFGEIF